MFYIEDYKELIFGQNIYLSMSQVIMSDNHLKEAEYMQCYADWKEKQGSKASPHMLRHYFANARRKDGWKLEMISQALRTSEYRNDHEISEHNRG